MSRRTATNVLDEYLVTRSQLGDSDAFRRLVGRWHRLLVQHASHITRDDEAARDVAQESWIGIVRGLGTLRDPARFRPWAMRIVANKARDWIRREQSSRRFGKQVEEAVEVSAGLAPEDPAGDDLGRVRAGLAELDAEQRVILTWFYLEEMSVREIADVLSIPAGTVKSRLFNARKALRLRLEEE